MNGFENICVAEEDKDFTTLSFGKYAGQTPEQVAEEDPGWIVWAYEEVGRHVCSEALYRDCKQEVGDKLSDY